jgi:hypothetical protein
MGGHPSPVEIPPQAEKMVEEIVCRGDGVEEFFNGIRMEVICFHHPIHLKRDGAKIFSLWSLREKIIAKEGENSNWSICS